MKFLTRRKCSPQAVTTEGLGKIQRTPSPTVTVIPAEFLLAATSFPMKYGGVFIKSLPQAGGGKLKFQFKQIYMTESKASKQSKWHTVQLHVVFCLPLQSAPALQTNPSID